MSSNLEDALSSLPWLAKTFYDMAVSKGFWDAFENREMTLDEIGNKLMLIVGEVSEAHEEIRDGHGIHEVYYGPKGKPEGFAIELADVFIRLMDLVGRHEIDLAGAIEEKHAYNSDRPFKHGKQF